MRETGNNHPNEQFQSEADLRVAYGGKFIFPYPAEGPDARVLTVKDFKILVSFRVEAGRFRINGVLEGTNKGVIISGVISKDFVKINHIELAEELRGAGIGKSLVSDLEELLQKQRVKTIYSAFAKTGTVEFFLKNGYRIVPFESLTEEEKHRLDIEENDFDKRVESRDSFDSLKKIEGNEFKKILLTKNL